MVCGTPELLQNRAPSSVDLWAISQSGLHWGFGSHVRPPTHGGNLEENLETYYRRRAAEYDDVYRKPERQADIVLLADLLTGLLAGCRVLEVAAGTGFWTEVVAKTAHSILATDVAEEPLAMARTRSLHPASVHLRTCDAFRLNELEGSFDAGLACFWLSHLPRDRMVAFLEHFGDQLESNSLVVLADNRFVPGSNHRISRVDGARNTYQNRMLRDGQTFEILKNFPDADELTQMATESGGHQAEVTLLEYYWLLTYRTGAGERFNN